jgi:hypothetical protein
VKRKRFGAALLIGSSLEAVLIACDFWVWHPPMWTQTPGLPLGFKLADSLHTHSLALDVVVFTALAFLVQGFLFSLPVYLLLVCASKIRPNDSK